MGTTQLIGRLLALMVLGLGACSGSATDEVVRPEGVFAGLADANEVELLALHPYPYQVERDGLELEQFHGYGVLGRQGLASQAKANELLELIEQGIEASDGRVAACFNPRHGLSIIVDETTWDILICYECLSMQVYRDGERVDGHLTAESVEPDVTAMYVAVGLQIHRDE